MGEDSAKKLTESQKAALDMMSFDPELDKEYLEHLKRNIDQDIARTNTMLAQVDKKSWLDNIVEEEKFLTLRNGMIAKCVRDLSTIMQFIDTDTYDFHVGNSKNDFADWIESAHKNTELAKSMRRVQNRDEMRLLLDSLKE